MTKDLKEELDALKLRLLHVERVLTLFKGTQAEITQKNATRFFYAWWRSVAGVVVTGTAYAFNFPYVAGAALLYTAYSIGRMKAFGAMAENHGAGYVALRLIDEAPARPERDRERGILPPSRFDKS